MHKSLSNSSKNCSAGINKYILNQKPSTTLHKLCIDILETTGTICSIKNFYQTKHVLLNCTLYIYIYIYITVSPIYIYILKYYIVNAETTSVKFHYFKFFLDVFVTRVEFLFQTNFLGITELSPFNFDVMK